MSNYENLEEVPHREVRSFLMARDPSIDRRFRPHPTKKLRLFDNVEEEDSSDSLDSEIDSFNSGPTTDDSDKVSLPSVDHDNENGALVYLRLRPVEFPSNLYKISERDNVLITSSSLESASSANNYEKQYSFSGILSDQVSQRDIYLKCIFKQIESEEDLSVLTYGTSGSGKTFTLLGTDDNPGILPRALMHIFSLYHNCIHHMPLMKLIDGRISIREDEEALHETQLEKEILNACGTESHREHYQLQSIMCYDHSFDSKELKDVSVFIWVSFAEIYNEFVYDLLELPPPAATSKTQLLRKNLKICCNNGEVFIKGLTSIHVKRACDALKLLRYGLQRANYASTAVNTNSSRSHCIFFVDVLKFYCNGISTKSSYKFCDLAGSERLTKTANQGVRLKEAQRINTSLLVLGRCLNAANNNRKTGKDVIPFRESKLTMLLKSALLGKEKLTMIVNVTPTDQYFEENLNVLNFASIARNIVYKKPVVKQNHTRYSVLLNCTGKNQNQNDRDEKEQLLEELIFLRSEIDRMKKEHEMELFKQEQKLRSGFCDAMREFSAQEKIKNERRLQLEIADVKRSHLYEMESLKRRHAEEIENLRNEYEGDEENDAEASNDTEEGTDLNNSDP